MRVVCMYLANMYSVFLYLENFEFYRQLFLKNNIQIQRITIKNVHSTVHFQVSTLWQWEGGEATLLTGFHVVSSHDSAAVCLRLHVGCCR